MKILLFITIYIQIYLFFNIFRRANMAFAAAIGIVLIELIISLVMAINSDLVYIGLENSLESLMKASMDNYISKSGVSITYSLEPFHSLKNECSINFINFYIDYYHSALSRVLD